MVTVVSYFPRVSLIQRWVRAAMFFGEALHRCVPGVTGYLSPSAPPVFYLRQP